MIPYEQTLYWKKNWKKINKRLHLNFTYGDLKQLLDEVRRDEHGVFKINIGFGSMLYDTVNQTYRYFYVSTNHYLFHRAYTISNNTDMKEFFKEIISEGRKNRLPYSLWLHFSSKYLFLVTWRHLPLFNFSHG